MHLVSIANQRMKKILPTAGEVFRFMTVDARADEVKPFKKIPGPPRFPVIGSLHLFSRYGPYSMAKLQDAYLDLHRKYGDIVRLDVGITMVILFRPEDIEQLYYVDGAYPKRPIFEALKLYRNQRKDIYSCAGLVTENGPEWRRLRDATNFMMVPHFAPTYLSSQEKIAEDFVSFIQRKKSITGVIPDFLKDIYRYTEEAIGVVCFGMRLGLLDPSASNSKFSAKLTQAADDTMRGLADTFLGFPWWKFYNTRAYKRLVSSQDFFQSFASDCVKRAKEKLNDPNGKEVPELKLVKHLLQNPKLSTSDISLLMTEIFSAGIDATGNIIGFLLYNLTKRPDSQEQLYDEIKRITEDGLPLTVQKIDQMKFLRACVKETYRLTPTSGGNARIIAEPLVLSGYHIPANVLCVGQNPTICRLDKHFDKPLEFMPERWFVDSSCRLRKVGHPYCILPFSHGVRRCVGQRFAEQEIKLAIIKIIERFRVEYDGPEIGNKMRMSLIPDKPLDFTFIER